MSEKAKVIGYGVYFEQPIDTLKIGDRISMRNGWLRTGSREVHGIKTYPTLDEATAAILADPELRHRVGKYQIVAEYAFFCQRGEDCEECRNCPEVTDMDWNVVRDHATVNA